MPRNKVFIFRIKEHINISGGSKCGFSSKSYIFRLVNCFSELYNKYGDKEGMLMSWTKCCATHKQNQTNTLYGDALAMLYTLCRVTGQYQTGWIWARHTLGRQRDHTLFFLYRAEVSWFCSVYIIFLYEHIHHSHLCLGKTAVVVFTANYPLWRDVWTKLWSFCTSTKKEHCRTRIQVHCVLFDQVTLCVCLYCLCWWIINELTAWVQEIHLFLQYFWIDCYLITIFTFNLKTTQFTFT